MDAARTQGDKEFVVVAVVQVLREVEEEWELGQNLVHFKRCDDLWRVEIA